MQILEIAANASADEPIYGFALAEALSEGRSLTSHGTLYKALSRMADAGLLAAEWESPGAAELERRPRRRHYRVTGEGERALSLNAANPGGTLSSLRPVHS